MAERIEFETPENVQVGYDLAGLGSRFVAWIIDILILGTLLLVLFLALAVVTSIGAQVADEFAKATGKAAAGKEAEFPAYIWAIFVLILSFASLLYFGLSELLMRGQTIGKRMFGIRVVKANGFSLDINSLFLRNVFRAIDHIPAIWLVPFFSKRAQRFGDMIGGTLVVKDEVAKMSPLRELLLNRPAEESQFHFSAPALQRLRPTDVEAVEKFLERSPSLKPEIRDQLLTTLCDPLAKRLEVEPPEKLQRMRFLQELFTAELRRQYRQLG